MKNIDFRRGQYLFLLLVITNLIGSLLGDTVKVSVTEAIEIALNRNATLKVAEEQLKIANYSVSGARSGFFPKLYLTSGISWHKNPVMVTSIQQTGVFPPLDDEIYESSLLLRIPLIELWRNRSAVEAAKSQSIIASISKEQVTVKVVEKVVEIYLGYFELVENKVLLDSYISALERRAFESSELESMGRISPADVSLLSSNLAQVKAQRIEIEHITFELSSILRDLIGFDQALELRTSQISTEQLSSLYASVSRNSLSREERKGLVTEKADYELKHAKANLSHLARQSFIPELSGFASYNFRSGSDLEFNREWVIGLELKMPLFLGGQRLASYHSGKAAVRLAEESLRSAESREETEFEILLNQWKSIRERRSHLEYAVAEREKAVAAFHDLYSKGRFTISDLLERENDLLELQMQEKSLLYYEASTAINFYSALGTLSGETIKSIIEE